jgi:hypothetical protein
MRLSKPKGLEESIESTDRLLVISKDAFLLNTFCDAIRKTHFQTNCSLDLPEFYPNHFSKIKSDKLCYEFNCKIIYLDLEIKNSSIDFLKNLSYSILSLTFGVFVSTSADVDYKINIIDPLHKVSHSFEIHSKGKIGMWAILPIYAGTIATVGGTVLNTYRMPNLLQNECGSFMNKKIDLENCDEYFRFLIDSYNKIDLEFKKELNSSLLKLQNHRNSI